MKKTIGSFLSLIVCLVIFAGCQPSNPTNGSPSNQPTTPNSNPSSQPSNPPNDTTPENNDNFDTNREITVVSREDGSGTRGAFIELFKIEIKNADGTKKDMTTKEANIVNKTDVMMTTVANDPYSIGYVSLGSLNQTVKAISIDGTEATNENVKNGTYKIARPFNIATKGEPTGIVKDFIDFVLSKEGQEVVSKSYIAVIDDAPSYTAGNNSGKIVIGGSSSVSPVIEKLKEAYVAINPNVSIEVQTSDSTAGMTGAMEGTCQIGMASRDLKDSEKAELKDIAIAIDGLAVIVNTENPLTNLTAEQIYNIFTGESTMWNEIN